MTQSAITAYRAAILDSLGDPAEVGIDNSYRYFKDGLMVIENGHITALGEASDLLETLSADITVKHYSDALIIPGFIDTHIHYPQTGMIASYGEQLLDWLENYTFPAEQKFIDPQHAAEVSDIFINELLRNGTTTALVFGTVHSTSVDAFFHCAEQHNLRMIAGKVMMDRNAPAALTDTPASSYADSKALIERWHGKGRLHYAVTPRFAPTSTPEQLSLAGKLLQEYPGLYLHTHLSENNNEIAWVKELFPEQKGYLDVYDHHQLLGERSVFAHGVHLCDDECQRLADTNSAIAFCPTSNLFLGSGLFNLPQAETYKINVGMGTDVGAGTSFSMLQTINEAYKVMQLQGHKLHPFKSFYLATLGGAKALQLEDKIGNLEPGSEADFVVLDYNSTPLMKYRMAQTQSLEERLFVMMTLGDDRAIKATYAMGKPVYRRD
ncbi:guanine deaminase [Amphritea sp. 1_MG-2023]|uniref:guanine deaminase n=1 Tax=Amphritea sp. 1_MG-2023 TaxID=3062670 RepID=UPI0026E297EB|nr:guanine deaminase [Amphritea sp. 1_MG-2023]MDO6564251.1 guanine deaminase [Amphritea sp. 1_MG-2023]